MKPRPPAAQLLNQPAAPRPGSQIDQVAKGEEGEGGCPRPGQGLRLGKIAAVVQPGRGIAQNTRQSIAEPVSRAPAGEVDRLGDEG